MIVPSAREASSCVQVSSMAKSFPPTRKMPIFLPLSSTRRPWPSGSSEDEITLVKGMQFLDESNRGILGLRSNFALLAGALGLFQHICALFGVHFPKQFLTDFTGTRERFFVCKLH